MTTPRYDCGVIVGAGVIGLAVASELGRSGLFKQLWVLEKEASFGTGISSRNSEVIHAGVYYPPQSLKAQLCIEGRDRLYDLCDRHSIPHLNIGKLMVAVDSSDLEELTWIEHNARASGVTLEALSRDQASRLEPSVRCCAALYSPRTGIIDAHALMKVFLQQAEKAGVEFVFNTSVAGIDRRASGYRVETLSKDGERFDLDADVVVNAAGLFSDSIARMVGGDYRLQWCKGCYFSVAPEKARRCSHLIYPAISQNYAGLGVHVTFDLTERMRLGPDVEYIGRVEDYAVPDSRAEKFYRAASRYLPFLEPSDLNPEMAGIRPKLQGPSDPFADFVVRQDLEGFINCVGIESPGLTASPAIAARVRDLLKGALPLNQTQS